MPVRRIAPVPSVMLRGHEHAEGSDETENKACHVEALSARG